MKCKMVVHIKRNEQSYYPLYNIIIIQSKVMVVSRVEEGCSVTIDGEKIEEVQSLKYLGSSISADGSSEEDIEQRIGAAMRVVGAMRKEVLERRELKKETKLRVFNAMVVPTLLYACLLSKAWLNNNNNSNKNNNNNKNNNEQILVNLRFL